MINNADDILGTTKAHILYIHSSIISGGELIANDDRFNASFLHGRRRLSMIEQHA